ncbi:hypothetical protein Sdagh_31950 [Streptomyces daghestanicus]|uniref:Uncharacterized protein n=1 Tax=Streptomyces daghestanicus TaxID=66885 RepID=A0ABQ3Q2K6_9ACTN|nr:hypothetical protein GCM10010240_29040 [Streptomyces griseoviridis]GHI31465.1 hypothetical protein Sdagh_31950 [Streptomyces daghestanicus]
MPGREAGLRVVTAGDLGSVRIEVGNSRGECLPRPAKGGPDGVGPGHRPGSPHAERTSASSRG